MISFRQPCYDSTSVLQCHLDNVAASNTKMPVFIMRLQRCSFRGISSVMIDAGVEGDVQKTHHILVASVSTGFNLRGVRRPD